MKLYIVVFYNRVAQQTQTFQVFAPNKFRAGRAFYRKYNRKAFHSCIENIEEVKPIVKQKPNIVELLNIYYGTEAQTLEELFEDIAGEYDEAVPEHMQQALRYVKLRTEGQS